MLVYVLCLRGTKEAFAQDETAASLALEVISKDWDVLGVNYSFPQRLFVYMPLMHSERLEAHVGWFIDGYDKKRRFGLNILLLLRLIRVFV